MKRTARTLFMAGMLVLTLGVAAPAQAAKAHPVAAPASNGTQVERPYRAFQTGTSQVDFGDNYENCFFTAEGFTCPASTKESGKANHLGKVTASSEGFVTFTFEDCVLLDGSISVEGEFKAFGEFVNVAANGDELHGTYENTGCVEDSPSIGGEIVGSQTITGGTGRFTNATGSTTTKGSSLGDAIELAVRGTISY